MSSSSTPSVRPRGASRWVLPLFLGAWFGATAWLGAWTVAQHVVPLPTAHPTARAADQRPRATHVLGADCGCSAAIGRDLAQRGPRPGWQEEVWLLSSEETLAADLRRAGFSVQARDADAVARDQGIQGAPWLVLHTADGAVAYSGGYARLRPGLPGYENLEADLMAAVAAGAQPESLRAYGCATSQAWRDRLAPTSFPSLP